MASRIEERWGRDEKEARGGPGAKSGRSRGIKMTGYLRKLG